MIVKLMSFGGLSVTMIGHVSTIRKQHKKRRRKRAVPSWEVTPPTSVPPTRRPPNYRTVVPGGSEKHKSQRMVCINGFVVKMKLINP